jgi:hypothetical protein
MHSSLEALKLPSQQINPADSRSPRKSGTSGGKGGGCTSQGKPQAPPEPSKSAARIIADDGRPIIYKSHRQDLVNDEAIKALANDPDLYERGGWLVQVMKEQPASVGKNRRPRPRIRPVPQPTLLERLAKWIDWRAKRSRKNSQGSELDDESIDPPTWCMRGVHQRGLWPGIRRLEGVADFPLWLDGGRILYEHGYDAASELYQCYSGPPLELLEKPNRDDALQALRFILHFVEDFEFAAEMHKSAWLAALLTPFVRFAFEGSAPMFVADANVAGAGKGKLFDIIGVIATGQRFNVNPYPTEKAEFQKFITACALGGQPWVLFDNVVDKLGDPNLDAILTNPYWESRLLGSNQLVTEPLHMTFFATGNNVQLKGDIGRRICHIRLESACEHPEDRKDFRYPNLLEAVGEKRLQLLQAIFTILRAYAVAGRPPQGLLPWGSYEAWSEQVRRPLVWLGLADPALTFRPLQKKADMDRADIAQLADYWRRCQPSVYGMTTRDFIHHIEHPKDYRLEGQEYAPARELLGDLLGKPTSRALGKLLAKHEGTIFNGLAFKNVGVSHQTIRWAVISSDPFPGRLEATPQTAQTPLMNDECGGFERFGGLPNPAPESNREPGEDG